MVHGPNVTGSIKMSTVIGNALSSQIKVGLNQSAMTAEKAVGNNSHAVAAHIGVQNGYLVYTVWVIDPNMKFNRVIVDAGNGKVLSNQPISEGESMMIHGMMMGGGGMMMQYGPGGMMMRGGGYSAGGSHGMMMGGPGMGKSWP
jgi:copper(I)-binding protein